MQSADSSRLINLLHTRVWKHHLIHWYLYSHCCATFSSAYSKI
jgi:hypothetical protein